MLRTPSGFGLKPVALGRGKVPLDGGSTLKRGRAMRAPEFLLLISSNLALSLRLISDIGKKKWPSCFGSKWWPGLEAMFEKLPDVLA